MVYGRVAHGDHVEKVFGRSRLIAEMCEPVRLLATYNEAVRFSGRAKELPLWSDSLLARVGASQ